MTDWISSVFMKTMYVCFCENRSPLILFVTDYLITNNSMEQRGFYAR